MPIPIAEDFTDIARRVKELENERQRIKDIGSPATEPKKTPIPKQEVFDDGDDDSYPLFRDLWQDSLG